MTVFVAGNNNPFNVMTYNWKTTLYSLFPNVFKVLKTALGYVRLITRFYEKNDI